MTQWKLTSDQRRTVLLLEALGLIHDIGKFNDYFLRKKSTDPNDNVPYDMEILVDPARVYGNINLDSNLWPAKTAKNHIKQAAKEWRQAPFKIREDLTDIFLSVEMISWDGAKYNFAEMSAFLRPGVAKHSSEFFQIFQKNMAPAILVGIMHGVAHFEKEEAKEEAKQSYKKICRATPFGYETLILVENENGLTRAFKNLPFQELEKITDSEQREEWLMEMRRKMLLGIADTRRPQNDVSLWDWGKMTASMTKSAAVNFFKNPDQEVTRDINWRILRINIDILGAYRKADTIADLLGIRDTIINSRIKVKKILESDYAFANQIYQDETGDYYLFPDFPPDDELLSEIRKEYEPDLQPQIFCEEDKLSVIKLDSNDPLVQKEEVKKLIARPRNKALKSLKTSVIWDNNFPYSSEIWSSKNRPPNAEICTVCGFYPVGFPILGSEIEHKFDLSLWAEPEKAVSRKICRVCLNRRSRRSEVWATKTKELSKTIWTGEVADENNKLAIFIGQFGLDGWLDGSLVSTLRVSKDMVKLPSPARLSRIARTLRRFWKETEEDIIPLVVPKRKSRLLLYPSKKPMPSLGKFHAYEIVSKGLSLEVVWDQSENRFITCENMEAVSRKSGKNEDQIAEAFKENEIRILESGGPAESKKDVGTTVIESIKSGEGYDPVIIILTEPGLFMVFVPAKHAMDLVMKVKEKFENEMARVRNRLPMHTGLVFFGKRTPIRAVLEAAQNMLKLHKASGWELWEIKKIMDLQAKGSGDDGPKEDRMLTFHNDVSWRIPLNMKDKETQDIYYANFLTENPGSGNEIDENTLKSIEFFTPELTESEGSGLPIYVLPSRFDFEHIDASGRRFEIIYENENGGLRRPTKLARPYLLEDLDRLDMVRKMFFQLTVSQRYQVIHAIEATREKWFGRKGYQESVTDETYRTFVANSLAVADWKNPSWKERSQDQKMKIIDAGIKGELADLMELYMHILKNK